MKKYQKSHTDGDLWVIDDEAYFGPLADRVQVNAAVDKCLAWQKDMYNIESVDVKCINQGSEQDAMYVCF